MEWKQQLNQVHLIDSTLESNNCANFEHSRSTHAAAFCLSCCWTTGSHKSRKHIFVNEICFWNFFFSLFFLSFEFLCSPRERQTAMFHGECEKLIKFSFRKQSISIEKIINWTMCCERLRARQLCDATPFVAFICAPFSKGVSYYDKNFVYCDTLLMACMMKFSTWTQLHSRAVFHVSRIINGIWQKSIRNITYSKLNSNF